MDSKVGSRHLYKVCVYSQFIGNHDIFFKAFIVALNYMSVFSECIPDGKKNWLPKDSGWKMSLHK